MGSTHSSIPFLPMGLSGIRQQRSELKWEVQVQILALPLNSSMTLGKPFLCL